MDLRTMAGQEAESERCLATGGYLVQEASAPGDATLVRVKSLTISYGGKRSCNYQSREYHVGVEVDVPQGKKPGASIDGLSEILKRQVESELQSLGSSL